MKDLTTSEPEIWSSNEGSDARLIGTILDQPVERYVPRSVTCDNCGCRGDEFSWFQRIRAGEVDEDEPGRDLYFCSILCLGYFSADNWEGYSPETQPTTHSPL